MFDNVKQYNRGVVECKHEANVSRTASFGIVLRICRYEISFKHTLRYVWFLKRKFVKAALWVLSYDGFK
ncbi:MAG TPA: hypothetical protein DD376_05730 [Sutterella sp.]|nr:hypothetical protein [Sutterella sp.]